MSFFRRAIVYQVVLVFTIFCYFDKHDKHISMIKDSLMTYAKYFGFDLGDFIDTNSKYLFYGFMYLEFGFSILAIVGLKKLGVIVSLILSIHGLIKYNPLINKSTDPFPLNIQHELILLLGVIISIILSSFDSIKVSKKEETKDADSKEIDKKAKTKKSGRKDENKEEQDLINDGIDKSGKKKTN